jgi:hypothetical protein
VGTATAEVLESANKFTNQYADHDLTGILSVIDDFWAILGGKAAQNSPIKLLQ